MEWMQEGRKRTDRSSRGRKRPGMEVNDASSADEDYCPHETKKKRRRKVTPRVPARRKQAPNAHHTASEVTWNAGGRADWAALPPETLSNVFRMACQENACPTVARIQLVCRSWRDVSRKDPILWRQVDFLGTSWIRPTSALVRRWCESGLWCRISSISLRSTIKLDDQVLKAIALGCPFLSALDLSYTDGFTAMGIARVLKSCPIRTLQVECAKCPNHANILDVVRVIASEEGRYQRPVDAKDCLVGKDEEWIRAFQKTQQDWQETTGGEPELEYQGMENLSVAMCPRFTSAAMQRLAGSACFPSLKSLNLTNAGGAGGQVSVSIKALQSSCPLLVELRFNSLGGLFGWTSTSASRSRAEVSNDRGFPQLKVCEIAASGVNSLVSGSRFGESQVYDSVLYEIIHKSDKLSDLDIAGCSKLSPKGLMEALHPAAPLRTISIGHSGVTKDEILEFLCTSYRDSIEGIDAAGAGKHVTDRSAVALAKCSSLSVVSLGGSAITDVGVHCLSKRPKGKAVLQRLNISGCRSVSRDLKRQVLAKYGER